MQTHLIISISGLYTQNKYNLNLTSTAGVESSLARRVHQHTVIALCAHTNTDMHKMLIHLSTQGLNMKRASCK